MTCPKCHYQNPEKWQSQNYAVMNIIKATFISVVLGIFITASFPVSADTWPMEMYSAARTGHSLKENQLRPPLKLKWNYGAAKLGVGPVVDENYIYFAGVDGKIAALNKTSGTLVWENKLTFEKDGKSYEAPAKSSPVIDGDMLYIASGFKVLALDKTTGRVIWQIEIENYRQLTIWNELLLTSTKKGVLSALDKRTGSIVWSYQLIGRPGKMVVSEIGIFVDGYDDDSYRHVLYPIDPDTRQLKWKEVVGDGANFMAYDSESERLFSLTTDGELFARDADSGTIFWKTKVHPGNVFEGTSPAVDDKYVYLTSAHYGEITAVSKYDGKTVWQQGSIPQEINTEPVVANGVVYVGAQGGIVAALDKETGSVLWQYDLDDIITATAAVSDGILYVGGRDKKGLFAFESSNPGIYVPEQSSPATKNTSINRYKLSLAGVIGILILWIVGAIIYVKRAERIQISKWRKLIVFGSAIGVSFISELLLSSGATAFIQFTQDNNSWPIFSALGNWYGNILLSRILMASVFPASLLLTLIYLLWLVYAMRIFPIRKNKLN